MEGLEENSHQFGKNHFFEEWKTEERSPKRADMSPSVHPYTVKTPHFPISVQFSNAP